MAKENATVGKREMARTRRIRVVVFDDFQLLDAAGPAQVFGTANDESDIAGPPPYDVKLVSVAGGAVRSSSGVVVMTETLPQRASLTGATLIIAGGPGARAAGSNDKLVRWIKRTAVRAERLCSVCTGAFLLARTGLVEGGQIVTHWRHVEALQELYPAVQVQGDAIFLRSGRVYSSAGVTSGIDLCLSLVEADLGRAAAMKVAKRLVVYMKRPGGQRQFSSELLAQGSATPQFDALIARMRSRTQADWTIETMAAAVGMSARTFQRRFTAAIGATPVRYLSELRLERACDLIERSRASLKEIARRSGFGSEVNMKNAFARRLGVLPRDYLDRFR